MKNKFSVKIFFLIIFFPRKPENASTKIFKVRDSPYTVILANPRNRIVKNLFLALFIAILANEVFEIISKRGNFIEELHLITLLDFIKNLKILLPIWISIFLLSLLVYPLLKFYLNIYKNLKERK